MITKVRHEDYLVSSIRMYHCYTPGYDDIYIPSTKGIDENGIGNSHVLSNKFAKLLSPFLLVNGEIVDARNDSFYNFVHECNGEAIDSIKNATTNMLSMSLTS